MKVEITCECGTTTIFSRETLESGAAHCPDCGRHIVIESNDQPGQPAIVFLPRPTPPEVLNQLRADTCYPKLRTRVDSAANLTLGFLALMLVLSIIVAVAGELNLSLGDAVDSAMVLVFAMLIVSATRRILILLIDIADALVSGRLRDPSDIRKIGQHELAQLLNASRGSR